MPRMYDILRGRGEDEHKNNQKENVPSAGVLSGKENGSQKPPISFPKEILGPRPAQKEPEDHSLASKKLLSAVKQHGVDNQEKAQEVYDGAVEIIEDLIKKIRLKEDLRLYMAKLYELIDNVFNQLVLGDSILNNIYEREQPGYGLAYHIANVLILSSVIGLNMGFNKSRLSHLGLACVFYDVGLDAFREITSQSRKLTEEEYSVVKKHISKSLEAIETIGTINDVVKDTVRQHHERVSGTGYPRGLMSDKINPYAKILGLVDTYEAITHKRPYREGMNTHKAVRFLITSLKSNFDPDAMKLFINKMSVYPIGSIVRLDTEEVARVVSVQPGSPLRPVVMILRDARGEPVQERIIIDLSKQDFPSIKDSI